MRFIKTVLSRRGRSLRRVPIITTAILALGLLLFPAPSQQANAQGAYSLNTVTANNGQQGITFEITASKSVRLYRFWNTFNTGSGTVEIWARQGGVANQNSGWNFLGQANYTSTSTTGYTEIPYDLDFLMDANSTWGFMLICSTGGVRYRTGATPYVFTDSYMSIDTQFWGVYGTTNPNNNTTNVSFGFYPRQFCGRVTYDEGITGPNDAGIASIDSPLNFCAGQHDVKVTLRNNGTNYLTSATVNWTLNGAPQTAYNWTGSLDTLNNRETQLTLGSYNFLANTPYTITVWTSMPNGVADTINNNDTASVTAQAAIAGTFTIGGASPDYPDFASAVNDLNNYGLCGPAVFNVRSGTYNEQISLGAIPGASAVNTVTFQSETGNTPDVNLTYGATSSTANYVVEFDGSEYVTFKNMTMTATGSYFGHVLNFSGSENITVDNCELVGYNTTSTSYPTYYDMAVINSESGTEDNYVTIRNCGIREGSYGMYWYGGSSNSPEEHNTIENCEFTGQHWYVVYHYYQGNMNFVDNTIESTSPAYYYRYGLMSYYGYNNNFERNTILIDGGSYAYGMYIYRQNYYQSGTTRIVNNFISIVNNSRVYAALRNYYSDNSYIAHNTIYSSSPVYNSTTYAVLSNYYSQNAELYNNIIYNQSTSGRAFSTYYASSAYNPSASDYNVFYTNSNVLAYWSGNRTDLAALQTASGMDQNSITKTVFFENPLFGDLHLTGASEDDTDLFGTLLQNVTVDIDNELRVNPYRGADEACYVLPGSLTYEFVDGQGQPAGYAEAPGTIGVKYGVTFPEYASTVTFTVQFYNPVTNALVYETSFSAAKQYGVPLSGTQYITLPATVPPGAYKIEVVFNTKNSCDVYRDYMPYPSALLVVPEGRIPCVVWPGDANNDGVVNYTDRRALNMYIYNANLRTSWLNGPPRYQADVEINPFTYLEWKPQAAAPWQTPEGCYMDTDGNGVVNNLDYIAMKLNWSKMTPWYGGAPKADASVVTGFMMDHNYPNPFNPVTVIRYSVPEPSTVSLVITDALGRIVVEERNQGVEKGMHEYTFDGSGLSSGVYVATMTMTGIATGGTYTKTIKMALTR